MAGARRAGLPVAALGVVACALLAALVVLPRTLSGRAAVPVAYEVVPAAGSGAPVATASPAVPAVPAVPGATAAPVVAPVPAAAWTARIAAATGIPTPAVAAYGAAQLAVDVSDPGCRLSWNTLAGIGAVESDHGRHGGAAIGADGVVRPTVLGPPLDGTAGNRAVPDTDGGRLDGDPTWDRAVGPMQFVPATWSAWGRSAAGGVPDPNSVDDAALTAAVYLCAAGVDMSEPAGWRAAVASYNEPPEYAAAVADAANAYSRAAGGGSS